MTKVHPHRRLGGTAAVPRLSDALVIVVLAAGAVAAPRRTCAQADALGIAPPQTVGIEAAQSALDGAVGGLSARYERWQHTRVTAASSDSLPQLPVAADAPAPPDAPDGEISAQREELGQ